MTACAAILRTAAPTLGEMPRPQESGGPSRRRGGKGGGNRARSVPGDRSTTRKPSSGQPRAADRQGRPSAAGLRREAQPPRQAPKRWGSVARRGARVLGEDADTPTRPAPQPGRPPNTAPDQEVWLDEGIVEGPGGRGNGRGGRVAGHPVATGRVADKAQGLPDDIREELAGAAGRARGAKLADRLAAAARAYARDRY